MYSASPGEMKNIKQISSWALFEQRLCRAPEQRQELCPLGKQSGAVRTALLNSARTAPPKNASDLMHLNVQLIHQVTWALYVERF